MSIGKVIIFTLSFIAILFGGALYYNSHVAYPVDCSGIKDQILKNDCDKINNQLNNVVIVSIGIAVIGISFGFGAILNAFLNPKQLLQNEVKHE